MFPQGFPKTSFHLLTLQNWLVLTRAWNKPEQSRITDPCHLDYYYTEAIFVAFDISLVCIFNKLSLSYFYDHRAYQVTLGKC